MIFIKKEKSKFNKSIAKVVLTIILCIFVLVEVIIYAKKYYTNNNLCFTQEDKFLFNIFIVSIIFICGLTIYLIIKQKTLTDLLKQVFQVITESESNIISLERSTQEIILKMFNKDK